MPGHDNWHWDDPPTRTNWLLLAAILGSVFIMGVCCAAGFNWLF
jgi:hypothetical protein